MKEKVFVDTNIFVYLKLKDEKNRDKKSARRAPLCLEFGISKQAPFLGLPL
jgi:predicted nucleic acid-binding protein